MLTQLFTNNKNNNLNWIVQLLNKNESINLWNFFKKKLPRNEIAVCFYFKCSFSLLIFSSFFLFLLFISFFLLYSLISHFFLHLALQLDSIKSNICVNSHADLRKFKNRLRTYFFEKFYLSSLVWFYKQLYCYFGNEFIIFSKCINLPFIKCVENNYRQPVW